MSHDASLAMVQSPEAESETRRPGVLQRFSDHNPLYIVSGVLMFGGCFLVSSAAHEVQDQLLPLAAAVGTVGVYAAAVVGLALWLLRREGHERDVMHLLLVAALLAVDGPLLFSELAMAAPLAGACVAAVVLIAAVGVATVVLARLGVRLRPGGAAAAGAALALIYAVPLAFRYVAADGFAPDLLHMAAWWAVGLSVAAAGLPVRWERLVQPHSPAAKRMATVLRRGVLTLLLVSTVGHAAAMHYLFDTPWHAVYAAPALLGLAVLLIGQARRPASRSAMLSGASISLALALLMAVIGDEEVSRDLTFGGPLALSPLRLTLLGIAAACVLCAVRWQLWWWLSGAAGALLVLVLGHSPQSISHNASEQSRYLRDLLANLLPRTRMQWGFVVIVGAFLSLALGALISAMSQRPVGARPAEGVGRPDADR